MIIKARSPFHIQQQNLVAAPETPQLLCEDIDFAGFEVNVSGAITQGTAKLIEDQTALTISSISPASFDRAVVTEPRTIFVNITIPSGYLNAGGTLNCSTIVTQEAQAIVLTCKTMRVINNSTTETLKVKYIECGNVEKILTVGTDSQEDVCVESNTSITYYSGSTNWQEKFISYGCTTGSSIYTVQGELYRGTSHANAYANVLNNYSAGRTPAYFRAADTGSYPETYPRKGTMVFKDNSLNEPIPDGFWGYDLGIPSEAYKASIETKNGQVLTIVEHENEIV